MKFKVHQFATEDLTIHEALEPFKVDDVIETLDDFYRNRMTRFVIWDLNNGGDATLTVDDMQQIIDFSKDRGGNRPDGKSAIVTNNNVYFGISRMFETHASFEPSLPLVFRAFRTTEEAKNWFAESSR